MIPVTKPFLPPKEEYQKYVDKIWDRNWLTNNGPLVNELELNLKEQLKVPHILYVTNGTIALQLAIRALKLSGEIITTPFTYVATVSSIVWEGCKPVFVDIDPNSLNIDPHKIEAGITPNTSAIMATHVYGNPCDIESIQRIADKHGLKVIYDAAHGFGTTYKGNSVYAFGDISTASFHATKLYHTIEGGAVFSQDPDLIKKMSLLRNFGHSGYETFDDIGINGKNSEFHAAMGLANLKYGKKILERRKEQWLEYGKQLKSLGLKQITIEKQVEYNYAYYPLILPSESVLIKVKNQLEENLVFPRRYFYPGINRVKEYGDTDLPVCDSTACRVLCLPMYHQLSMEEISFISRIISRALTY